MCTLGKGLRLFLVACFLAVMLGIGTTALPTNQYPVAHAASSDPTITLIPPQGKVGDWFQAYGKNWPVQAIYAYWEDRGPIDQVMPNENGDFLSYIKVPDDFSPGKHYITYDCVDGWTGKETSVTSVFTVY